MVYTSSRSGEVTAGPFPKGMNNKTADYDLPDGTVRNIVNADITDSGTARQRAGLTKVYSGLALKGGYKGYFIEGGDLCYLNDNFTKTILISGLTGTEFCFCYQTGKVYFSDGVINRILSGTSVSKWGLSAPSTPTIIGTTGTYSPGTYLAAISWVDIDGVEHGSSNIASLYLGTAGGISFINLPALIDGAVALRLYLSAVNGKELYHIADVTSSSYSIMSGRYDEGLPAENLFVSPPPPASIIRFYKGRAYVADTNGVLWYSNPFAYSHFVYSSNYIVFSEINIVEPVNNGIFIATDTETFFYEGTPENGFNITKILDYGAIKGTGYRDPKSTDVLWLSTRGIIRGSEDGSFENTQEANVAVESGDSGSLIVREQNGLKQAISVIKNPTTSVLAATSFIDAEIIRRS